MNWGGERNRFEVLIPEGRARVKPAQQAADRRRRTEIPPEGLSADQITILRLLADGLEPREIAESERLTEAQVATAIQKLRAQLGARNRVHLIKLAMTAGII